MLFYSYSPQFQSRFQSRRHLPPFVHMCLQSTACVCARMCVGQARFPAACACVSLKIMAALCAPLVGYSYQWSLCRHPAWTTHTMSAALSASPQDAHSSRLAYAQQRQPSEPQPQAQPPSLPPRPHRPSAPTSSSPSDSSSPPSASNASEQSRSLLPIMLASATSGALARIPLHPIDTIKAKLQTLPSSAASTASAGVANGATLASGAVESVAKPSAFGLVRATFRAEVLRARNRNHLAQKNVTRLALFVAFPELTSALHPPISAFLHSPPV